MSRAVSLYHAAPKASSNAIMSCERASTHSTHSVRHTHREREREKPTEERTMRVWLYCCTVRTRITVSGHLDNWISETYMISLTCANSSTSAPVPNRVHAKVATMMVMVKMMTMTMTMTMTTTTTTMMMMMIPEEHIQDRTTVWYMVHGTHMVYG